MNRSLTAKQQTDMRISQTQMSEKDSDPNAFDCNSCVNKIASEKVYNGE